MIRNLFELKTRNGVIYQADQLILDFGTTGTTLLLRIGNQQFQAVRVKDISGYITLIDEEIPK